MALAPNDALAQREAKIATKIGTERSDIVAAVARMHWKMGGRRELKKLVTHLHDGERVEMLGQGTYEGNQGIVALTDARLLFLFHGIVSQAKEDFPLRLISSVQTKSGFSTGELRIFVAGAKATIFNIVKTDLEPLADAVRRGMAIQHAPQVSVPVHHEPAFVPDEPYKVLHELASMRDSGVLTEEEFTEKKKQILDRL